MSSIVVHYLGVEAELDMLTLFKETAHLLGEGCRLHIAMVGPEVRKCLFANGNKPRIVPKP